MIPLVVLVAAIATNIVGSILDQHSSQIAGKLPGARELNPLYRGADGKMDGRGIIVLWAITAGLAGGHIALWILSSQFQYAVATVEVAFAVEHFYGWISNTRTVAKAH